MEKQIRFIYNIDVCRFVLSIRYSIRRKYTIDIRRTGIYTYVWYSRDSYVRITSTAIRHNKDEKDKSYLSHAIFFPDRGLIHIHNNNWQPIMCCTTIILYLCKRVYIILLLLWVAIRLYVFSIVNIIFYTIHDWCAPIQYNIYSILF